MRLKLAEIAMAALCAAGGELIVRLCATSERLDCQRELALVRRQLEAAKRFGAYWHAKACDYKAACEQHLGQTDSQHRNESTLN